MPGSRPGAAGSAAKELWVNDDAKAVLGSAVAALKVGVPSGPSTISTRFAIGQVTAHPFYACAGRLLAPRQRAQREPCAAGLFDHRLPDEAGAAGNRQGHSRTS